MVFGFPFYRWTVSDRRLLKVDGFRWTVSIVDGYEFQWTVMHFKWTVRTSYYRLPRTTSYRLLPVTAYQLLKYTYRSRSSQQQKERKSNIVEEEQHSKETTTTTTTMSNHSEQSNRVLPLTAYRLLKHTYRSGSSQQQKERKSNTRDKRQQQQL